MLLDKFLILNTEDIKEQVTSIYQWLTLLQHLFQKELYISGNVCGSVNTNSTKVVHILFKYIMNSLFLFSSLQSGRWR